MEGPEKKTKAIITIQGLLQNRFQKTINDINTKDRNISFRKIDT